MILVKKMLDIITFIFLGLETQNISEIFAQVFIDLGTFLSKNKPTDKKKPCFERSRLRDEL